MIRFAQSGAKIKRAASINVFGAAPVRYYANTSVCLEEAAEAVVDKKEEKRRLKLFATDYNRRRALYKRQVSELRKSYAKEVAAQRIAAKAEQEAVKREMTRKRLERQRMKNIRSAKNAMRQEELRLQREKEFQEHLRVMQLRREETNDKFAAARQLVVDELEEEAPLWLTTAEEVEAAFTPEAVQLLWARPGGVLGAPNPSLDCHFWQFETHTWHMTRSYKSVREFLLEEIEELAYEDANIDKEFWTPERIEEHHNLETKARLRAKVHSAGRRELLKKQREMLFEQMNADADADGAPKPAPVPDLRVLQNAVALENEGVRLLMDDPTRFFVFENSGKIDSEDEQGTYSGPSLGAPIGLRDELRENSSQGTVFPFLVGKFPKEDNTTKREKKRQEREKKLWAAAQMSKDADLKIKLAAEQRTVEDLLPEVDFLELDRDPDEEEWVRGLDPVSDKALLNIPSERRFSEADISWVLQQMSKRIDFLDIVVKQKIDSVLERRKSAFLATTDASELKGSVELAMLSLNEQDMLALSDLDDAYSSGELSKEELSRSMEKIKGLSEDQIMFILNRNSG